MTTSRVRKAHGSILALARLCAIQAIRSVRALCVASTCHHTAQQTEHWGNARISNLSYNFGQETKSVSVVYDSELEDEMYCLDRCCEGRPTTWRLQNP